MFINGFFQPVVTTSFHRKFHAATVTIAISNLEHMNENAAYRIFLRVLIIMLMAFCFTSTSLASESQTLQQNQGSQLSLTKLQTEYTDIPLGIDVQHPRFSWQMSGVHWDYKW